MSTTANAVRSAFAKNCQFVTVHMDIHRVSQKNFPYFTSYFSKSVFYLIGILKEICYTMINIDLSICFSSVSGRIEFL